MLVSFKQRSFRNIYLRSLISAERFVTLSTAQICQPFNREKTKILGRVVFLILHEHFHISVLLAGNSNLMEKLKYYSLSPSSLMSSRLCSQQDLCKNWALYHNFLIYNLIGPVLS
jgi:hypothetical protein